MLYREAVKYGHTNLYTYTKSYTLSVLRLIQRLISMHYGSLVPLKIEFCKECPFESDRGHYMPRTKAGVVELVDARNSKSRSAKSVGSIPTVHTIEY